MNTMIAKSEQGWPFKFYIEKAQPLERDGALIIEGIASTVNIDHDRERMAESALKRMANIINKEGVPLRIEHERHDRAVIGNVDKAWIDSRNQLWINATLDKANPVSHLLHDSLKKGTKIGLSVGGRIKQAVREFSEAAGKYVKTFYDVLLDEVSVTLKPANYDAWLVSKSMKEKEEDVSRYYGLDIYNEFLFENPQLDYLRVFAKSVPDNAWEKVEENKSIESMKKEKDETMETETKTDTETKPDSKDETKYASMEALNALKSAVTEGFSSIGAIMEKAFGARKATDTTIDSEAMDTNNPDSPKHDPEVPAKAETETGTETHTETETKTDDKEYGSDYQMGDVKRSIKRISDLGKSMETKKIAIAVKKSTGIAEIDQFVFAVRDALEAIETRIHKNGKDILGLRSSVIDMIRQDPEIQKSIKDMLNVPGEKRSVSLGIPYMATRDGRKYALTATEVGVKKSEKTGSFKDVYSRDFSSNATEQQ